MALATKDQCASLTRTLRAMQSSEDTMHARARELCAKELDEFERASKALERKMSELEGDAKYRGARDACDDHARKARRELNRAADRFHEAVEEVVYDRSLSGEEKAKRVQQMGDEAQATLDGIAREFPALGRIAALRALGGPAPLVLATSSSSAPSPSTGATDVDAPRKSSASASARADRPTSRRAP